MAKAKKKAVKKAVKKTAKKPKLDAKAGTLTVDVDLKTYGLEAALGAAYLVTDLNFVSLGGDRKKTLSVTLEPKSGKATAAALNKLAAQFQAELDTAKVRWEISRNNLPVREHVAKLAAVAKPEAQAPARPNETKLTDEQQSEIDRLIAEVESEIAEMNQTKAVPDPKGIRDSWEKKNLK